MKFLIDKSPEIVKQKASSPLVRGQLLTPLTRYANWGGDFAIDNGAFSGFDSIGFGRLLQREKKATQEDEKPGVRCLFVTVPDVVGNARRTMELWKRRHKWISFWPCAFVAQDGAEDMDLPWDEMAAIFIGGRDPWKDSQAVKDIVKTAKILGIHVHVGRVNGPGRFRTFSELGADTCDGTGVSRYDHMLAAIETEMNSDPHPLFAGEESCWPVTVDGAQRG